MWNTYVLVYLKSPKIEKSVLRENSVLQEKFCSKFEQKAENMNFLLENKTLKNSTRDSDIGGLAATLTQEDPDSAEGSKFC